VAVLILKGIIFHRNLSPYIPLSTFVERGTKGGEVVILAFEYAR
jgi:hypothetical protein